MPETSDRLAGYSMIAGIAIIFGVLYYTPQYFLPGILIGGAIMVIPTFGSEYIVKLTLAAEMHITAIIRPAKQYKGINQHWYFKTFSESIGADGLTHVILFLTRVWLHPKKGKVWYVHLRMKGAFASRIKLEQGGVAVLYGTAADHGHTDRCVFDENEYDIPELDQDYGPMPAFDLITGSQDEGKLFQIINKNYTPQTEMDRQRIAEEAREKIALEVIRNQGLKEIKQLEEKAQ
ncbi:MAG: hypothetical protein KGH64_06275 [Candidatus Micrarchaeota archaeon]|nr:hypothetical protein [Candidatus Micrarchaeota archaeon]